MALRRDDPVAARSLDADQRKVTRLDALLAGVAEPEQKAAIVRLAYNAGVDPNDPIFGFIVVALKLQRIVGADHAVHLENSRAVVEQARSLLADVRNSAIMVDGTFEKINQTLDGLPERLAAIITTGLEGARSTLAAHAQEQAKSALGEQATQLREEVCSELRAAHQHASGIRQAFERTKTATRLLAGDSSAAFGWLALNRRLLAIAICAVLAGVVLGGAACGWLVNATGFGLSEATRLDLVRGRTYAQIYPALPHSTKEFIRTWLTQHH